MLYVLWQADSKDMRTALVAEMACCETGPQIEALIEKLGPLKHLLPLPDFKSDRGALLRALTAVRNIATLCIEQRDALKDEGVLMAVVSLTRKPAADDELLIACWSCLKAAAHMHPATTTYLQSTAEEKLQAFTARNNISQVSREAAEGLLKAMVSEAVVALLVCWSSHVMTGAAWYTTTIPCDRIC